MFAAWSAGRFRSLLRVHSWFSCFLFLGIDVIIIVITVAAFTCTESVVSAIYFVIRYYVDGPVDSEVYP